MPVTSNYKTVQLRLKSVSPTVQKALNRDLRAYAKIVATQAKVTASGIGSGTKIPPTIGTQVNLKGAAITVKGVLGPLYERGQGGGGSWRHPVFGNDVWVTQATHPFLKPAVDKAKETIVPAMDRAVQAAAKAALG